MAALLASPFAIFDAFAKSIALLFAVFRVSNDCVQLQPDSIMKKEHSPTSQMPASRGHSLSAVDSSIGITRLHDYLGRREFIKPTHLHCGAPLNPPRHP
jgi:hypothetical protein